MASADTVGRGYTLLEGEALRAGLHQLHTRLKHNKALVVLGGWQVAVVNGHESHPNYGRPLFGLPRANDSYRAGKLHPDYHGRLR